MLYAILLLRLLLIFRIHPWSLHSSLINIYHEHTSQFHL